MSEENTVEVAPSLTAALRAVLPCASRDMSLPILTHVLLEGDYLYATDRFRLARARIDRNADDLKLPDGNALIPLDVARFAVARLKTPVVELEASDTRVGLRLDDGTEFARPFQRHLFEGKLGQEFNFPPVSRFFDGFKPASLDSVGPLLFNSTLFAGFSDSHFKYTTGTLIEVGMQGDQKSSNVHYRITKPGAEWFTGILVGMRG